MKELLIKIWYNWYFQDCLTVLLILLLGYIGKKLAQREYWRLAFRQIFQRRLIRICFGVLCLYVAIALLDSIGYHPPMRDAQGNIQKHTESGKTLYDPTGLSVLDVILTPIRTAREKTYSAPLATIQFTKETFTDKNNQTVRGYPNLRYPGKHILGTDRVGNDVLYVALKGVRTGIIIGGFTTLIVIPFAMLFGIMAGYYGGRIDDAIQYIYTVLSSIPDILLIASFMVIFGRGLPQLCFIMGITSWTGLCRILRGETLKLREAEYVQAAKAMGVSNAKIMIRHIAPNVMHIILITTVLNFSGLVLAEIVLAYIGIGAGANTISWGGMVTDAILELARDPVIWWKLTATFVFTLGLVLPANLLGDALRDALDPRLRTE